MPKLLKSCCLKLPQRWIFVFMGFLAFFNAYAMRVCLSITIIEIVEPLNETKEFADETCPTANQTLELITESTIKKSGTFKWSEYTQGIILSSFYWGCMATHMPGGMIAEKFGGKYTFGLAIFISAITTLLSPVGIWWGDSTALIVLRTIMGLACGTMYPAANSILSSWIPLEERSTAGSFVFAGASLGTAFANTISGLIIRHYEWPMVFYFFGTIGVVWFLLFVVLCYNNPREHPFISERETKYLHEKLSEHKHHKPPSPPWRFIMTSPPVWAAIAATVGHSWGFLTMISDLPKYMSSVLKFSIQDNGFLSSLPYLCMWIGSIISSKIFDWIICKKILSATVVRKIGTTISSIGPGIFLVAASYATCDKTLVVVYFTIGMTLMGCSLASVRVNLLDLSPNYAGSLMAFCNSFGAGTGIVAPYIVGLLTPNQTLKEWRLVFWIVFAVFVLTNVIFLIFGNGKVQEWNNPHFLLDEKRKRKLKSTENVGLLLVTNNSNLNEHQNSEKTTS